MANPLERSQMNREMHARGLEHAVWLALFQAQLLGDAGVDTQAVQGRLSTTLSAVSNLRRRLEDAECRLDGGAL